jgi:ABC-type antimicrobial peptide transport system permease subunit
MQLSAGYGDSADFVGIDPTAFKQVGYDYLGNPLEDSFLNETLDRLTTTPSGAIVSEDIAAEYQLVEGSTLRAFYSTPNGTVVFTFTILRIVEALSNCLYVDTDSDDNWWWWFAHTVGARTLWVNSEYLRSQINMTTDAQNIVSARVEIGANSTQVATDVLEQGGEYIVTYNGWASVDNEVAAFQTQVEFQLDRAIDTMLVIVLVVNVFGSFSVYAVEGVRARRREIALLRAMGAGRNDIIKAQTAEMMVISLIGFAVLLLFSPLSITISLMTSKVSEYIFPIAVFPVIPWEMILTILLFFIGSMILYSIAIAALSSRVKLAESLNAAWAESAPYGGEE